MLRCFVGTTRFQRGENRFVMSREVEDQQCENIASVANILKEDRWSSCRLTAEQTGILKTIV